MLFASSTNLYTQLAAVSQSVFGDIFSYIILIIGIMLGFVLIEKIIDTVYPVKVEVPFK